MHRTFANVGIEQMSLRAMNDVTNECCIGCGKELMRKSVLHESRYWVCSECTEIMQQGFHNDYFKVMKTVSRNLDHLRTVNI